MRFERASRWYLENNMGYTKPKTFWDELVAYMNVHPKVGVRNVEKHFGDHNKVVVRNYYSLWQRYIKPLNTLYELMNRKFVPSKELTLTELRFLRQVERLLGPVPITEIEEDEEES